MVSDGGVNLHPYNPADIARILNAFPEPLKAVMLFTVKGGAG